MLKGKGDGSQFRSRHSLKDTRERTVKGLIAHQLNLFLLTLGALTATIAWPSTLFTPAIVRANMPRVVVIDTPTRPFVNRVRVLGLVLVRVMQPIADVNDADTSTRQFRGLRT